MVRLSREQRAGRAKKFVAQSLQLRNDICNEPNWEAVFTDQEVNAWLAEDLVTHFADQLPPEVNEPRVLFELDRIILAFQLRQGGVQSVITVVARPRVPGGNTIELTLEKIRAGILPVPADNILDRIIEYARYHGLTPNGLERMDIPWSSCVIRRTSSERTCNSKNFRSATIRSGSPAALIGPKGHFTDPSSRRGKVLQSKFPIRKIHESLAPESSPDPSQIDFADQLRTRQLDPHVVLPTRPAPDRSPRPPVERAPGSPRSPLRSPGRSSDGRRARGRQVSARDDRRVDRPGPQDLASFEHEVPVHSIPVVLEQDKPRHRRITCE